MSAWLAAALAAVVLGDPAVVDGDTVRDRATGVVYRVENIDAPETSRTRARCAAEINLGKAATEHARLVIARARRIEAIGTGRADRYGRTIARLSVDGRDFGRTMIDAGLAQPWRGRKASWC